MKCNNQRLSVSPMHLPSNNGPHERKPCTPEAPDEGRQTRLKFHELLSPFSMLSSLDSETIKLINSIELKCTKEANLQSKDGNQRESYLHREVSAEETSTDGRWTA